VFVCDVTDLSVSDEENPQSDDHRELHVVEVELGDFVSKTFFALRWALVLVAVTARGVVDGVDRRSRHTVVCMYIVRQMNRRLLRLLRCDGCCRLSCAISCSRCCGTTASGGRGGGGRRRRRRFGDVSDISGVCFSWWNQHKTPDDDDSSSRSCDEPTIRHRPAQRADNDDVVVSRLYTSSESPDRPV